MPRTRVGLRPQKSPSHFDPEAGLWYVESHGDQLRVVPYWVAETPMEVVLDDAVETISGSFIDGLTDDNTIADDRSFVLWKGPDVATKVPTDPSRLQFTLFVSESR